MCLVNLVGAVPPWKLFVAATAPPAPPLPTPLLKAHLVPNIATQVATQNNLERLKQPLIFTVINTSDVELCDGYL